MRAAAERAVGEHVDVQAAEVPLTARVASLASGAGWPASRWVAQRRHIAFRGPDLVVRVAVPGYGARWPATSSLPSAIVTELTRRCARSTSSSTCAWTACWTASLVLAGKVMPAARRSSTCTRARPLSTVLLAVIDTGTLAEPMC